MVGRRRSVNRSERVLLERHETAWTICGSRHGNGVSVAVITPEPPRGRLGKHRRRGTRAVRAGTAGADGLGLVRDAVLRLTVVPGIAGWHADRPPEMHVVTATCMGRGRSAHQAHQERTCHRECEPNREATAMKRHGSVLRPHQSIGPSAEYPGRGNGWEKTADRPALKSLLDPSSQGKNIPAQRSGFAVRQSPAYPYPRHDGFSSWVRRARVP